jgi:hypothetical protein
MLNGTLLNVRPLAEASLSLVESRPLFDDRALAAGVVERSFAADFEAAFIAAVCPTTLHGLAIGDLCAPVVTPALSPPVEPKVKVTSTLTKRSARRRAR